jgi:hypothetical protein
MGRSREEIGEIIDKIEIESVGQFMKRIWLDYPEFEEWQYAHILTSITRFYENLPQTGRSKGMSPNERLHHFLGTGKMPSIRSFESDLDRMELQLRDMLFWFEVSYKDKARARRELLASAPNERHRQIWEILLKQEASPRGSRRGNRKNVTTKLKRERLLNAHADWQSGRTKPGNDQQFAEWWIERGYEKGVSKIPPPGLEKDRVIKRITKRLRDARNPRNINSIN